MPEETKPPHKKPHGRLANGYFRAYTIFTMSTTHEAAKKWVEEIAQLCQPDSIYWCNGACGERRCPDCRMAVRGGFLQDIPFSCCRVSERVKKTVLTGNLLASSSAIV